MDFWLVDNLKHTQRTKAYEYNNNTNLDKCPIWFSIGRSRIWKYPINKFPLYLKIVSYSVIKEDRSIIYKRHTDM